MKRDITLFDLWMRAAESNNHPSFMREAHKAKRFVFDSTASAFMGELLKKAPLEILRQHHFAKPPYDITWIEIDHDAYYRLGLQLPDRTDHMERDGFLGVYIKNEHATIVTSDIKKKLVSTHPIYFELHRPVSFEQELTSAQSYGLSRLTLRQTLLGAIDSPDSDWWMSQEAADICRSHNMKIVPALAELPKDKMQYLLLAGAGNLKLILTMLLLLVRPHSTFNVQEVGHRRAIIKGKSVVLKEHHVLKLRLEHKNPVLRYLSHQTTGLHRKEHDVRGHWAQNRRKAPGCSHDWVQLDSSHFQCVKCGTNRWWKTDHKRGKKQLGQVTKEYDVTR